MPDVIGGLTGLLGSGVRDLAGGVLDSFAKWVWSGGLDLLKAGIGLADRFGTVNVDVHSGPLAAVWPVTVPIGLSIAGLLFYLQLATVTAKGGRGLLRSVSGTAQFGVALAASAVMFASLVAVSDGFTTFILRKGLSSENFAEAFSHTGFSDATANAVKAGALLLMSIFGVVPISLGFAFENVMRAATIYLLVAVIPITAAGLVAGSTESWYWRTSNWLMAAIAMKPVMALALTLGVGIAGGGQGLVALIVGLAVLFVALFAPLALFRLFAFTSDKATDAFKSGWGASGAGDAVNNTTSRVGDMLSGAQTASAMEAGTDARFASTAGGSPTDADGASTATQDTYTGPGADTAGSDSQSTTDTGDTATETSRATHQEQHGDAPGLEKDEPADGEDVSWPPTQPGTEQQQVPSQQPPSANGQQDNSQRSPAGQQPISDGEQTADPSPAPEPQGGSSGATPVAGPPPPGGTEAGKTPPPSGGSASEPGPPRPPGGAASGGGAAAGGSAAAAAAV